MKTQDLLRSFSSDATAVDELLESDNWSLFRDQVQRAKFYAEWGSGLSTLYAAEQGNILRVLTLETDIKWVAKIAFASGLQEEKIEARHVDFGEVGNWGRPKSYSKITNVWQYSQAPFRGGYVPDLILIDGRFRVHCFLVALLKAKPGTKVIFDDYVERPHYHIVEAFVRPIETRGRQALFLIDTKLIDRSRIKRLSKKFSYVMD